MKKMKMSMLAVAAGVVALGMGGCASIDRTTERLNAGYGQKELVLYGMPLTFGDLLPKQFVQNTQPMNDASKSINSREKHYVFERQHLQQMIFLSLCQKRLSIPIVASSELG